MALTIGEASDVNTLLLHVLNLGDALGRVPQTHDAVEAAARLADKANKALGAGLNGGRVRMAWPEDEWVCAYGCGFSTNLESALDEHYIACAPTRGKGQAS